MSFRNKSKNYFLNWFQQNGNFLDRRLTSKIWDKTASEPEIQTAVKKNKQARSVYAYLDGKIILGYAKFVDYIMTEAFQKLNYSDFDSAAGFSRLDKGSPRVRAFFKVRNNLENFIRNDISQYSDKAVRCQAFQRWLATAETLRQRRCYEGVSVIFGALLQMDIRLKITASLPETARRQYAELESLIGPDKSFRALRRELAQKPTPHDFASIFMWARDLEGFNSVLGEDQNEIGPNDGRHETLLLKRKTLMNISVAKGRPLPTLPSYLRPLYEEIAPKDEQPQPPQDKAVQGA